ncbi:MAG: response regulator [Aureliella sp.]
MQTTGAANTNRNILLVDDEQAVLDGIARRLGQDYQLTLANDPLAAIDMLSGQQRFSVILTDMQMPGLDGLAFIRRAREISPHSVFLMLTGNQDLPTATRALNEGQVFRYFTKPCASADLRGGLDAALRQWELLQAERELLQRTFVGSVNILCDIMGIAQPLLSVINERTQRLIRTGCSSLSWRAHWEYLVAGKLALIGFVLIKPEAFANFLSHKPLSEADRKLYFGALETSAQLLQKIPRLERIAALVRRMGQTDGALSPGAEGDSSCDVQNGGTLLGLALAHVIGTRKFGVDPGGNSAVGQLYASPDSRLLQLFRDQDKRTLNASGMTRQLHLSQLAAGMVLAEDINVSSSHIALRAGDVLTDIAVAHLPTLSGIPTTMSVQVPSAAGY